MRLSFTAAAAAGNTFTVSPSLVICGRRCSHNCFPCCNSNVATRQLRRRSRQNPPCVGTLTPALLPLRHPQQPSRDNSGAANSDANYDNECKDGERSSYDKRNGDVDLCTPTDILRLMDSLQLPVDEDLYVSLIKECSESGDANQGANVHSHVHRSYRSRLYRAEGRSIANRLLLMYAACGRPESARQLFDQMLSRDATSWATMIGVLSASGYHTGALQVFVDMCLRGDGCKLIVDPSGCWLDALITTLRSCAQVQEVGLGLQVHGLALKVLGGDNPIYRADVGNSLIRFYSNFGHHESAANVFERTHPQDTAAWTSMIIVYCRQSQFLKALDIFNDMGRAGKRRNCHVTSSILIACARIRDGGWSGKQVHAGAIKAGASSDQYVGSSLVNMYMKHGLAVEARKAFEMINGMRDLVCWNSMLVGYARMGCSTEAISLLHAMKSTGIRPHEMMADEILKGI